MKENQDKHEGRVRRASTDAANEAIDQKTLENIQAYGYDGPEAIEKRLDKLDKEWDLERALETNASTLALTGVVLAATKDKRWLILSGIVASFLLQHGLQGWCPPLPLLRKFGLRTRKEIAEERYALKALRGDFNRVLGATTPEGVLNVIRD
ncbi:YgaP-like transmembrane domain [uncultured Pontibacter sp.]|uniref:YgaP-like transmembrane domain n=1 Tax=uncultured Pontibacter sp. TaxID=453356 RepID=UPI00262BB1AA|nr:YgaP-like transmembrane domain [uncultured Pontibacter sp.]